MFLKQWKGAVVALVGVLLSFAGIKPAPATPLAEPEPSLAQAQAACPSEYQTRQRYARVITQRDPLRIRATPNGRVIGAVPKGWAVVVLERDTSGQWTKITSHFGEYTDDAGFGSAPYFREGWVATRFLQDLGEFCEKPMAMGVAPLVSSAQPAPAADWLALGDEIAQSSQAQPVLNQPTDQE